MMTAKIKLSLVLLLVVAVCLLIPMKLTKAKPAKAETLQSNSYVIQFGNFNSGAGLQTGTTSGVNLTNTQGQMGAGPFGQLGSSTYFVGSGFQYIYPFGEFSFEISKLNISLGELTPGIFSNDSHTITVNTVGAGGYAVYAYEQRPLTHSQGTAIINDTRCDASDCDQTIAKQWTNPNIAGFGFSMTGNDIAADFSTNYYRQFADRSTNETMQKIMSATTQSTDRQANVLYRATISGSQAAGNYQTAIVFVAVPGF